MDDDKDREDREEKAREDRCEALQKKREREKMEHPDAQATDIRRENVQTREK